jgi:hypothetical protein
MTTKPLNALLNVKPLEGKLKHIYSAINHISQAAQKKKKESISFENEIDINYTTELRNMRIDETLSYAKDFLKELLASTFTIKLDRLLVNATLNNIQQLKTYIPTVLNGVDAAGNSLLDQYVKNNGVTHIGISATFGLYEKCMYIDCNCKENHFLFKFSLMLLQQKCFSGDDAKEYTIKSIIFTSEQEL